MEDTRHLSRLVLRLDGERPELLTSALVEHFSAVVHARKEALLVRRSDGSFASTSRRFPSTLRVVPERSSCCCRC